MYRSRTPGRGPVCSVKAQERAWTVPGSAAETKTPSPATLSLMDDKFAEGFEAGLISAIPKTLAFDILRKLRADPAGFDRGYGQGCLEGFGKGLVGLITSIVDIFKLG